jgi:heme-degrading monooxygenase HmoA
MHTVVRHYKGSSELIDELEKRRGDVEELIRGVPGFVAYYLVRTADGGASISVYEDSSGTEESTKRARAYIQENLASVGSAPPEVIEGEAFFHFTK